MLRNRRLARHVAGVGWGELRRQIEYKTGWAATTVHVADRWYPSSKTCSACGAVKAKLRLSERTYRCATSAVSCSIATSTPPATSPSSWTGLWRHVLPELRGRR